MSKPEQFAPNRGIQTGNFKFEGVKREIVRVCYATTQDSRRVTHHDTAQLMKITMETLHIAADPNAIQAVYIYEANEGHTDIVLEDKPTKFSSRRTKYSGLENVFYGTFKRMPSEDEELALLEMIQKTFNKSDDVVIQAFSAFAFQGVNFIQKVGHPLNVEKGEQRNIAMLLRKK